MQEDLLQLIVTCIGFLFVVFIICNIKGDTENFRTSCITQPEYNSLDGNQYSTNIKGVIDGLDNKVRNCYDMNNTVNKFSDGDCPNCEYAQNLFKHMDFKSEHNLGFGPMSNYCPHSLTGPDSQLCLRNLRGGIIDIRKLSEKKLQSQINNLADESIRINDHQQKLANNIDGKIKREYIDYYLKHYKPYEDAVHKFRKGDGTIDNVDKTYIPPKINIISPTYNSEISNNIIVPMDVIKPFYGHYQFEITHLKTILKEPNIMDTLIKVSENDIDKLLKSKISLDGNGIYIQYEDGLQSGLAYKSILAIPNIKNNELPAYRLIGTTGEYNLYPDINDEIYLNINLTTDILPSQFMQGLTYLLIKM